MIGRRVGSWVLERELGQGGMGSVYLARHASLPTFAAVKVLSPGLESQDSFRQRFQREAKLQAQLRHPNVARVLDYLEDGGQWFLVVEYLDRGSLADVLSRDGSRVPRAQALAWARQALSGLGYAHKKGIVHRDVKPANLLLNDTGELVVADFGIARADGVPSMTTTGIAVGTPQYMSPEQILTPERIDGRADIYSLGIVLYELLAGRPPFDSGSQFSILQSHVSAPPPTLGSLDPTIPPTLEAAVMRALAKRPDDRFPDCEAMIGKLDSVTESASDPTRGGLVAPPVGIPPGATVRATSLREPATPLDRSVSSPAERSAQHRRSFQRRLAVGAAVALVGAALFALQLSRHVGDRGGRDYHQTPPAPPPPPLPPKPPVHPDLKGTKHIRNPKPVDPKRVSPPPDRNERPQVPSEPPRHPKEPPRLPHLALPERPRIAVVAAGDPLLAGSLEQEMERRLSRHYDIADEHGEPDIDELLRHQGTQVSQKALGTALLRGGFQVLVLLRVEEAERRKAQAFGISGDLRAARMRLNAYLLPANRSIGRGWTEPVEYTELSAQAKARNAFIGATADLMQAIDQDWNELLAGSSAAR
ncbi:MAG TPA: serine/threonine-protein kinase [Thermoanaerobaculia bacterium]|nr:serine/threonine-protein kinase [Thermoanaerobaculia bacterium]